MLKNFKEKVINWFRKRYGMDELGGTVGIAALFFMMLGNFFKQTIFFIISAICMAIFVARFFSDQCWERETENEWYCRYVKLWKLRYEYRKEGRIFLCTKCGRYVKVPKGKGKIQITCPSCGTKMIKRT